MTEIIKVYDTEANAMANGTTGRIDPVAAVSGHGGIIANVGAENIPYYIYKKFYYRIEANEPVMEFHIDWDDGENNSPEKANIEIIKLEYPSFSVITSHIYTEHKHFFPLIRVKNEEGYLSKWYTNDSSLNSYSKLSGLGVPYSSGQNDESIVSEEKADTDRINSFLPANLPPIGILKVDKKRIFSGIDNDFIKSTYMYPLLYTYSSTTASSKPDIKFTLQDSNGVIREHTQSNSTNRILSGDITDDWDSAGATSQLALNCIPSGNFTASTRAAIMRIQVNAFVAAGVPPNWDPWWAPTNDMYFDIHYETSFTGDKNGYFHCRVYMDTTTSDKEGAPTGAIVPDNYSAFTVGVGSGVRQGGGQGTVAEQLRVAFDANDGGDAGQGMKFPFLTGAAVAGPSSNPYFEITMMDTGTVNTPNGHYNQYKDNAGDLPPYTSTVDNENEVVGVVSQTGTTGADTQTTSIKKLLRVELDNATELADTDRVYVNVFEAGNALYSSYLSPAPPDETVDKTIAILSNGNPIVELEDKNTVYLDGTESFTRASNLSISTYNFDEDKLNVGEVQATDADGVSDLMSGTFNSEGTKKLSYTFNRMGDSTDSNGRFFSTYRLPRLQVKDSMINATYHNAEATITITDFTELNNGDIVNLIATDGTNYDFTVGDQSSVNGTWEPTTSNDATATNLRTVINTSSGPSGTRFNATVSGAIITITQATAGSAGATTITLTDTGTAGMTKTNFAMRALDTLTYSAIEHFDDTSYTATNIEMPSDLESRGLLLTSLRDTEVTANWNDMSTSNIHDTKIVFGGAGLKSTSVPLNDSAAITDHPRNHVFIAKTEKFDRVFFRMENKNAVGETNWPPTVVITAYYGNGATWYPLEIIDETQGLQVSGSIKFNMPYDWKKGFYTDIDGGDWDGPVEETDADNTEGPKEMWVSSNIGSAGAYGLLICIGVVSTATNNEHKIVCKNIWPYNNSHSQLIKLEDPHHVSLNSIAIAQSISFGRSSKVISVEDKFGKADIRKIGAGGGSVRFGGIDLGNTDDDRKIIVGYQKDATPVFLDIEHKSGEKTRFFGVISQVTEDHPAGKMIPKWAVTMNISHVLELSSTGAVSSDKISIGGALVDDGKYLL